MGLPSVVVDPTPEAEAAEDSLFWQDEILQAMFWMTKEGIRSRFGPDSLTRFLDGPEAAIEAALHRLAKKGYVEPGDGGYIFTDEGERQAKRRFAQAFHDIQGFDTSHTNCGPDCWCHDLDHADEPCPNDPDHDHDHGHASRQEDLA